MNDELYRKLLKMKALERWENEGGRVSDDQDSKANYRSIPESETRWRGGHETNPNDNTKVFRRMIRSFLFLSLGSNVES